MGNERYTFMDGNGGVSVRDDERYVFTNHGTKFKPVAQTSVSPAREQALARTVRQWEERIVAELAESAQETTCPRKREAIRNMLTDAGTGAVVGYGLTSEPVKRYQAALAIVEG